MFSSKYTTLHTAVYVVAGLCSTTEKKTQTVEIQVSKENGWDDVLFGAVNQVVICKSFVYLLQFRLEKWKVVVLTSRRGALL